MPISSTNDTLTSSEVAEIQRQLIAHGFDPGPVDGLLGPRTAAAIVAFKRSIGFVARPWVGPQTWAALMKDPAPRPVDLPWIREALRVKGWHERADNRPLRDWLKSDGHALGDPALYPWCGDFVETAIRLALPDEPIPANPYWALNWRGFGVPCGQVRGAVCSIRRSGGGHVFFAVGQNDAYIYGLGGNQSDRVSVAAIPRYRIEPASWRWPSTWPLADAHPLPHLTVADADASGRES